MDKIASHSAEALKRLPEVLKNKPQLAAWITALCQPAQTIEDVLYQLLVERTVDAGSGAQLDTLGKIVGQPRDGLNDTDYRRYIRARIATNKSSGLTNELLHIARLIVNDSDANIRWDPSYPTAGTITVSSIPFDATLASILVKFLRAAAASGVRILLEWTELDTEDLFFWDTTSWDDGLAWSSSIE